MVVVSVLAAYAFSRLEFKGKELVFTLFLALMMIPSELVVITNYVTITELNLRNTFTGLILPSVTSVFYIYLLRENFSQIPDNLYLAAKVDGTGDFKYLCRVVVPICKPTIITVGVLPHIKRYSGDTRVGLRQRKRACYDGGGGYRVLATYRAVPHLP